MLETGARAWRMAELEATREWSITSTGEETEAQKGQVLGIRSEY